MAATEKLILHRYPCSNTGYVEELAEGVELPMMQIPAGEFLMGSAADDPDADDDERPQHWVNVPRFFMGRTPVTQAQWRVVAGYGQLEIELHPNPSVYKGDDLPVEVVTWYEAREFCKRLTQRLKWRSATPKTPKYRLPSEAEWEYACRAGMMTAYHFGNQITPELANYNQNVGQTSSVASYPPNRWGLHDMHGNVWEWCADHWHENYNDAPKDGSAWVDIDRIEGSRVIRGGSWNFNPRDCHSAYRNYDAPGTRYSSRLGFRVCCSPPRALP